MTDVLDRLRAANPEPGCPPPAIDATWRRLDAQDKPASELFGEDLPARGSLLARVPSVAGVMTAVSVVIAVAVAIGAIALLGRSPTKSSRAGAPALESLHAQAGRLFGSIGTLEARLKTLRGYPVVITVWASWCAPCRNDLALLAPVAARHANQIAFVGVDTADTRRDALSFLARHPISYPTYQAARSAELRSIVHGGIAGLPTTIFIDSVGKVVSVHIGAYQSATTLERDISAALQPANIIQPTFAELAAAFPIFGREQTPQDKLPAGYLRPARRLGANLKESRLLLSVTSDIGSVREWIVPAGKQLCAVQQQDREGGISCTGDRTAVQQGIINAHIGRAGGLFFGVLPNGTTEVKVTHPGAMAASPKVATNGAFAFRAVPPAVLSFREPDGTRANIPLPPFRRSP